MTVSDLLRRIDSRELTEWAAFYALEPWGTDADDMRAGIVASTIANVNRDPKKQRRPFQPSDFIPRREPKAEQTPEEQARILQQWARAWEGKFEG